MSIINVEELAKRKPKDSGEYRMIQAANLFANMEKKSLDVEGMLQYIKAEDEISQKWKDIFFRDWYYSFKYFDETITNWLKANTELLSFKLVEEEREERKERLEKAFREAIGAVFFLGAGLLIGRFLF